VRRARLAAVAPCLLLASACVVSTPVPEPVYSPCHVLGSSGWRARIELFPSNHPKPIMRRMLVVNGKVSVAGNGLSVGLARGPVSRLDPPVQQILVRTEGSVEEGAAPVTHVVRGAFPALKRYGGVSIRCGDGIIGEVREIPAAPRDD
jgi:hypothetical protein